MRFKIMNVPVEEGKTYDVNITSVGDKGDGIARVQGFIVIVPHTKKGDHVKIKVKKVLEKVSFAEVVEKLEKPARRPSKFVSINPNELKKEERAPEYNTTIEDTEDFGADLEEE
jgi:predicted RNA-binding protein with TRAM domain